MQTPGAPTTVNMSVPLAGATFSELRAASRAAVAGAWNVGTIEGVGIENSLTNHQLNSKAANATTTSSRYAVMRGTVEGR